MGPQPIPSPRNLTCNCPGKPLHQCAIIARFFSAEPAMRANACGVDFGTSNSTVGWLRPTPTSCWRWRTARPRCPRWCFQRRRRPHRVFTPGAGRVSGWLRIRRLMRSLKAFWGTGLANGQTEVNGQALRFIDLLSLFIRTLKARAKPAPGASSARWCLAGRCFCR